MRFLMGVLGAARGAAWPPASPLLLLLLVRGGLPHRAAARGGGLIMPRLSHAPGIRTKTHRSTAHPATAEAHEAAPPPPTPTTPALTATPARPPAQAAPPPLSEADMAGRDLARSRLRAAHPLPLQNVTGRPPAEVRRHAITYVAGEPVRRERGSIAAAVPTATEAPVEPEAAETPAALERVRAAETGAKPKKKKNMPHPRIELDEADLIESFIKGSGPGGQKINKCRHNVQLTHKPTGIVVESQKYRHLALNRHEARKVLKAKLDTLYLGDQSKAAQKAAKLRKAKAKARARHHKKHGHPTGGAADDPTGEMDPRLLEADALAHEPPASETPAALSRAVPTVTDPDPAVSAPR